MTPKDVLAFAKEQGTKMVDFKFLDFPGIWQHFSVPISELEESYFEEGFGFDGSSIRGWQPIHASDMLVIPDPYHGHHGSIYQGAHAEPDLQHRGSDHRRKSTPAIHVTSLRRPKPT